MIDRVHGLLPPNKTARDYVQSGGFPALKCHILYRDVWGEVVDEQLDNG